MDSSRYFFQYLEHTVGCFRQQELTNHLKAAISGYMDVCLVSIYTHRNGDFPQVTNCPHISNLFLYQPPHAFLGYETLLQKISLFRLLQDYDNPGAAAQLAQSGVKSLISFPIWDGSSTAAPIAALVICLPTDTPPPSHACTFLQQFCTYLHPQLIHAFQYQELETETTQLLYTENGWNILFKESVDFICILDEKGYFRRVNPSMQQKLGYASEELIHRHICNFVHPDDRAYLIYLLDYIQSHTIIRAYYHRYVTKSGKELVMEFNAQYLTETGLTISIAKDLTNQKAMEKRNEELEQRISMEQIKTQFFSNISHGLKTPLNVIQSSTDLIRFKLQKADPVLYEHSYAKFFGYVKQNCFRLLRLISNLLDYSKLEIGDLHLQPVAVAFDVYIEDLLAMLRPYAETISCQLQLHNTLSQPATYYFDPDKLDRIILNVLSNSLKNSKPGDLVEVTLSETDTHLQVMITDMGKGIAHDVLPLIFDRLQTTDESLVKTNDGMGMGLCLSKALVLLHHGCISATSCLDEGTTVTFTISKFLHTDEDAPLVPPLVMQGESMLLSPYLRQSRIQMELSDLPTPFVSL